MNRIFLLLLTPILLAGCSTEYFIRKFMDGPKFCPSDEVNKVVQNRRGYKNLSNRLNRDYVIKNMSYEPDRTEYMLTDKGQVYVADHYQTTASYICGGNGIWGEYDPVFYLGGVVVGKGERFYREKLEFKIVNVDVVPQ
jgi:hypothetical protein